MLFLHSLAFLLLSLFVSAAPISSSPKRIPQAVAYEPVRFINHFGSSIQPDTSINLEWTGGSGKGFDVYYIPQWPQQKEYYPVELVSGSTSNHFTWHTPKADEFPKGTTFILGVNDAVTSLSSDWYDITGMMNFAH
ncbi:uncharacterized protein I206_104560 [Kwoniella pini CBS 10737]|uniref:Purple acid phosphatase N-terminal domain-containing protein n=1 Tax=Kwoniella pini CBS 10737 TaxID=1296096 RepID=A0A1B9I759_9TREE|nr:uncharacterized protein I206_02094 [Kwoniella pini CBS 10737]OCF51380.1 hypothetical protein I206_02094 [Kwoniella pini CBS 10737]